MGAEGKDRNKARTTCETWSAPGAGSTRVRAMTHLTHRTTSRFVQKHSAGFISVPCSRSPSVTPS
jgi:hypothetical protein